MFPFLHEFAASADRSSPSPTCPTPSCCHSLAHTSFFSWNPLLLLFYHQSLTSSKIQLMIYSFVKPAEILWDHSEFWSTFLPYRSPLYPAFDRCPGSVANLTSGPVSRVTPLRSLWEGRDHAVYIFQFTRLSIVSDP